MIILYEPSLGLLLIKFIFKLNKVSNFFISYLPPLFMETITQPNTVEKLTDNYFWENIINSNLLAIVKNKIEYLLNEFGTFEPCNRFDVGNTIEFILNDHIVESGFKVNELPNAKRYDVDVENYKKLSIKYSSGGEITLHNSNSCVNTDLEMKDTSFDSRKSLFDYQ